MMMPGGFTGMGMPGMDMNAMAASMTNPIMIQELMMNQMALMAQISGMMNPNQFGAQGFQMQNMQGDMGMFPGGGMNGAQGGRGRGSGRGGRGAGRGRGRGAAPSSGITEVVDPVGQDAAEAQAPVEAPQAVVAAPIPVLAAAEALSGQRVGFVAPERPQSPTLCKFSMKCTNPICRYSHPSPVATAESGMVLSNEACENGKDCKDKDCVKAHVSPAVLNPQGSYSIFLLLILRY
jgi:hypothetical protein